MSRKPETVFKEQVRPRLDRLPNTWVVKIQQVSIRGTPDFLLCVSGVFVAIELKTEEGRLDKLQEWNLKKIAESGGIAIVLTPSNVEKTLEFLEEIAHQAQGYFKENEIIQ